jgi:hypothetical protein
MSEVYFEPWVGDEYSIGIKGKKIMVLGHNHYCDCRPTCQCCPVVDCKLFTLGVIKKYLEKPYYDSSEDKSRWRLTYNNFEKAFFSRDLNDDERRELWNHLLFYNLVQEAMPDPNTIPNREQYANAIEPFRSILREHKPDVILAWGNGAYNHTPNDYGVEIESIEYGRVRCIGWRYLGYEHPIDIFKIRHPSRCFSYRKWNVIINKILNSEYSCPNF